MVAEGEAIRRQTSLRADRFDLSADTVTMKAVVTTRLRWPGHARLSRRPGARAGARRSPAAGPRRRRQRLPTSTRASAGIPSGVTADTRSVAEAGERGAIVGDDGGWSDATPFPLIQGTDCCGRVVTVGSGGNDRLIGLPCRRAAVHASPRLRVDGDHLDGLRLRRRLRAVRESARFRGLRRGMRVERRGVGRASPALTGRPRTCCIARG